MWHGCIAFMVGEGYFTIERLKFIDKMFCLILVIFYTIIQITLISWLVRGNIMRKRLIEKDIITLNSNYKTIVNDNVIEEALLHHRNQSNSSNNNNNSKYGAMYRQMFKRANDTRFKLRRNNNSFLINDSKNQLHSTCSQPNISTVTCKNIRFFINENSDENS
jgi:hypothetical protein